MASMLKKVWFTGSASDLVALSIESADPTVEHHRVTGRNLLYPHVPTAHYPLRHVLVVEMLGVEDLVMIRDAINEYLEGR